MLFSISICTTMRSWSIYMLLFLGEQMLGAKMVAKLNEFMRLIDSARVIFLRKCIK